MTHQQYIQTIRDFIAKDDLTEAIARLKELLNNTPLLNKVLQQSGQFENIQQQIRLGTVSHVEANMTQNEIRGALLELVTEMEQQDKTPAIRAEMERAVFIVNSKNVVVGSTISAGGNVHIGDQTEVHHHYGEEHKKPTKRLKIGAVIVTVIGVLAGIAGFTGFSIKDFWKAKSEPITTPAQTKPETERPAAPEDQRPTQPSNLKKTVTSPRNHFESHDSSKQINIPDNKGTINIHQ